MMKAQEIPTDCARCHSTPGYLDFLGADGTPAWVVDNPAPVGTTIECDSCHNSVVDAMTSVAFNSGAVITGLGKDASCMQCHQGRNSTGSVNDYILASVGLDLDVVNGSLSFQSIHNHFIGDLRYGTWVQGGYEYDSKSYDAKHDHVAGFDSCVDCHEPHSLAVPLDNCQPCHPGVTIEAEVKNIRMSGSLVDYDGDGDIGESIEAETAGLRALLYQGLRQYGREITLQPIAYTPDVFPFYFQDLNDNGIVDPGEGVDENVYASWTGRLLQASYNYHLSIKAPGSYLHGSKYVIQLLYDSMDDLNGILAAPVDLAQAHRIDSGHFAGSEMAWRNWDDTGWVPQDCAHCHSPGGFAKFLQNQTVGDEPVSGSLNCDGCHNNLVTNTRYSVMTVRFTNGSKLTLGDSDNNMCLICHQSRNCTSSVDSVISGLDLDTVDGTLSFINPHNQMAGSTLFGDQVEGMYQYAGHSYLGRYTHDAGYRLCLDCHDTHLLEISIDTCTTCHTGVSVLRDIRESTIDYDGDGDDAEGIAGEIESMVQDLYLSIQSYATVTGTTPIVYSGEVDPFFFIDSNGNGEPEPNELDITNAYNAWTPRLLRVAYNFQYVTKENGAFAHNPGYVIQVLYDSIADLGGDVSAMTRP